jgi:hypothetical protein
LAGAAGAKAGRYPPPAHPAGSSAAFNAGDGGPGGVLRADHRAGVLLSQHLEQVRRNLFGE